MTSIAVIIVLAPMLFVAVRRMRHATGWPRRIGLAVAVIVVFSALHITGMVGLRELALFLVGGSYDFRFSVATLIYEFRKDVVTCFLIGGALWLIDSRREGRQSRSAVSTGRQTCRLRRPTWSGSATVRPASGSNPATSFGSVPPEITSNTASRTAPITSSGQPWPPRKRD